MTRSTAPYKNGYVETNPGTTDLDKLLQNFGPLLDSAPLVHSTAGNPGVNDDSANTSGNGVFSVFSKWLNTATQIVWQCIDASPGAAVWAEMRGPVGETGAKGDTGDAGATGAAGAAGATGARGPQGPQGETGATGAAGTNSVTSSTTTNLTGILKGNGEHVGTATAGTDYVAPASPAFSGAPSVGLVAQSPGTSGTVTINWAASARQLLTLPAGGAAVTLAFTAPPAGVAELELIVVQGAVSSTLTLPAGIEWAGGVPYTANVADSTDIISLLYDGSTYYGSFTRYELPPAAPSAPTGLTATTYSHSTINLSWTAPSGSVTGYNIYRGASTGAESTTALGSSATTSYSDTSCSSSTTYYYTVKATNSVGNSPASNEASATTSATPVVITGTMTASESADAPTGSFFASQLGPCDNIPYGNTSCDYTNNAGPPGQIFTLSDGANISTIWFIGLGDAGEWDGSNSYPSLYQCPDADDLQWQLEIAWVSGDGTTLIRKALYTCTGFAPASNGDWICFTLPASLTLPAGTYAVSLLMVDPDINTDLGQATYYGLGRSAAADSTLGSTNNGAFNNGSVAGEFDDIVNPADEGDFIFAIQ